MFPQLMHAAPWLPHWLTETVWHRLPWQQAFGHEVALHTQEPLTHCWPVAHTGPVPHLHAPPVQLSAVMAHAEHAAPLVPHEDSDGEALHWLPAQQPPGHEVALHTHWPFTQR
jgi:hypothetical protein